MTPERIYLPIPRMGSKIWLLESSGMFVLEECAGLIRTNACTHAGAGSTTIVDGVPDKEGHFQKDRQIPPDELDEYVRDILATEKDITEEAARERVIKAAYNGRPIFAANPSVMGSWMMDGGFYHGLTIVAPGGHQSIVPYASIVWMPRPRKVKKQ